MEQDRGRESLFTLVLSSTWNIEPACFNKFCCSRLLSVQGRCFCFNQGATGFVRAEGCGGVVLAHVKEEDDTNSTGINPSIVRSVAIRQCGAGSKVAGPPGVNMQRAMDQAVQKANFHLGEINVVECHAPGAELHDALEIGAVEKVFARFFEDDTLPLTSVKTVLGSGYAAAGLFSLLKVLGGTRRAVLGANNMLKQLNFRIDTRDLNFCFITESLTHPVGSSGLTNINNFGSSGTHTCAVIWGDLVKPVSNSQEFDQVGLPPAITFWPAGGGELDPMAQPRDGYYIVGSFSQWTEPQKMEQVSPGEWFATITLGFNRWEQFQIWLDGDESRVLHPAQPKAPRNCPVFGPIDRESCYWSRWQIDGRQVMSLESLNGNIQTLIKGAPSRQQGQASADIAKWVEVPTRDLGEPGQQYEVRLRIAGKYRAVDWKRLDAVVATTEKGEMVESPLCKPTAYYIVANWNNWAFEKMVNDEAKPERWSSKLTLQHDNGVFTIVRNKDWGQVFYPENDDEGESSKEILGPDDANQGRCWMIRNSKGMTFQIEFVRMYGFRTDDRHLSWQVVKAHAGKSMQVRKPPHPTRDVNGIESPEPTAQVTEPTKPVDAPSLPENHPREDE